MYVRIARADYVDYSKQAKLMLNIWMEKWKYTVFELF